jgi:hypothetical protein
LQNFNLSLENLGFLPPSKIKFSDGSICMIAGVYLAQEQTSVNKRWSIFPLPLKSSAQTLPLCVRARVIFQLLLVRFACDSIENYT